MAGLVARSSCRADEKVENKVDNMRLDCPLLGLIFSPFIDIFR